MSKSVGGRLRYHQRLIPFQWTDFLRGLRFPIILDVFTGVTLTCGTPVCNPKV